MHTLKVAFLLTLPFALFLHATPHPGGQEATSAVIPQWTLDKIYEPGSVKPTLQELEKCVDTAAQKLGIDPNMQSDPAIVQDVLKNIMHLDNAPVVQTLLAEDLKKAQPMAEFLKQVRRGMTQNHPVIGVVACLAQTDPKASKIFTGVDPTVIKRTLNHMFILNKIVSKCSEDNDFMAALREHMKKEVAKMVGSESWYKRMWSLFKAAGVFGAVKDYSIELGMQGMEHIRDTGETTEDNIKGWGRGLTINILEATATEFLHGYLDNASVGKAISQDKVTSVEVTKSKKAMRLGLSMDFARLYETWNLAFITGNLEFLHILYPKLLIPRVILASGQAYIYERVLALWLSIQFFLMADLQHVPHVRFPGQEDLATLWGKVNYRYLQWIEAKKVKRAASKAAAPAAAKLE